MLNRFQNMLMDLLPKIFNIFHNMLMDMLPDLRIARSTTPAGGRQGQERSRKNRGGNNNQHLRKVFMIHLFWKDTFEDDRRIPKQNFWHLQSLPMGGAAWNWEGTKFEQEFTRSVQVGWTGCCNDQFLHVGLVCYAVPQFILYRVSQKNVLIECCWSHVAQAQSPVHYASSHVNRHI